MPKKWFLVDVEARSNASMTFQIPSSEDRKALAKGDYVKLIFENEAFGESCVGERMWVQVLNRLIEGRYVGLLCNYPTVVEHLEHGDAVEFGAEHVCEIERKKS